MRQDWTIWKLRSVLCIDVNILFVIKLKNISNFAFWLGHTRWSGTCILRIRTRFNFLKFNDTSIFFNFKKIVLFCGTRATFLQQNVKLTKYLWSKLTCVITRKSNDKWQLEFAIIKKKFSESKNTRETMLYWNNARIQLTVNTKHVATIHAWFYLPLWRH